VCKEIIQAFLRIPHSLKVGNNRYIFYRNMTWYTDMLPMADVHEGMRSGNMVLNGIYVLITINEDVRTSVTILKIVGDSSLNTSFQFSFRNMFMCSPGT
jgi:hypothetical protein